MRLVYVDEAGISNAGQEPFLIVAGVLIDADSELIKIEQSLDQLVRDWIPEEHQAGFVFHAKDLFNGGGKIFHRKDERWPLQRRRELAGELALIIDEYKLPLALGVIEKAAHQNNSARPQKDWTTFLHALAFTGCALVAEHWVRANCPDEVCMIISEDNTQSRSLIRDVIRLNQAPEAAELFPEQYRHLVPMKHIREDPLFQPKRSSSVLQLADFWAYIAKKHYMRSEPYEPYWHLLRPNLGPAVWPSQDDLVE